VLLVSGLSVFLFPGALPESTVIVPSLLTILYILLSVVVTVSILLFSFNSALLIFFNSGYLSVIVITLPSSTE
jgi:hypothetical protein